MWDGRLKPRFFPRSLREPRPDCCDVQDAQVLEQDTPAEAQGLKNEVVEKVVGRLGKIGGQDTGNVNGIMNELGNGSDEAGTK